MLGQLWPLDIVAMLAHGNLGHMLQEAQTSSQMRFAAGESLASIATKDRMKPIQVPDRVASARHCSAESSTGYLFCRHLPWTLRMLPLHSTAAWHSFFRLI